MNIYGSGTIEADGTLSFDGLVRQKWRVVKITRHTMAVHSPGGSYWSGGTGMNYAPSSYLILPIKSLRRGNREGTWRFKCHKGCVEFHSVVSKACRDTMSDLEKRGDEIAKEVEEANNEDVS